MLFLSLSTLFALAQHYECIIEILRRRLCTWNVASAAEQVEDAKAFEAVVLRLCLRVLPFDQRSVRQVINLIGTVNFLPTPHYVTHHHCLQTYF